jgi:hypothetical protein
MPGCDIASILDAAARLPSDANGFRETLWGWVFTAADDGHIGAIQQRPIVPGVLVITRYGEVAIVLEEARRPSKKWLHEQERPLRAPDGPFWTALVLRGGAVVFTAPDVYVAGAPDDDQIDLALEMGTVATAKRLVALFPKLVDRVRSRA